MGVQTAEGGLKFTPLGPERRDILARALKANADDGKALLMDPTDTTFLGYGDPTDDEVIGAIKSVPCHYASAAGDPDLDDDDEDDDDLDDDDLDDDDLDDDLDDLDDLDDDDLDDDEDDLDDDEDDEDDDEDED